MKLVLCFVNGVITGLVGFSLLRDWEAWALMVSFITYGLYCEQEAITRINKKMITEINNSINRLGVYMDIWKKV